MMIISGGLLDTSFQEQYAGLSDDELLFVAASRSELTDDASLAMDSEMARRGLSYEQAHAKKREVARLTAEEEREHHRKPIRSKYFVTTINLWWLFLGIAGLIPLMLLMWRPHRVFDEWTEPVAVTYTGAVMACSYVQPWLRRTFSFWFSLMVSAVPQFYVSRWLTVYHPAHNRSGSKGIWFLSILVGYAVGGALFLLLQKLKPTEEESQVR